MWKSEAPDIAATFAALHGWCKHRGYAGWDPFDALNSQVFRRLPLVRSSRAARLLWTQTLKRSPLNLRRVALVPAGRNAKGLALFALALLARYRRTCAAEDRDEAETLLEMLLAERLTTASGGVAWGYNFDWQGRAFFAARGTPTVVPTAFAVRALVEGHELFARAQYLDAARGAAQFILGDLRRSGETADEVCFSYTPGDRTRVYNASLLAGEALTSVGELVGDGELIEWGVRAARYVARRQRADGSWAYGADDYQSWADNFHTAFVLTSLGRVRKSARRALGQRDEATLGESLRAGRAFWRERFFLADGWPKYYHDRLFPADAHSAGAALVALAEMNETGDQDLARRVARWTVESLWDARGFFYYQRRRFHTVRTPFMRWTQSWMLYGLARLLESEPEGA